MYAGGGGASQSVDGGERGRGRDGGFIRELREGCVGFWVDILLGDLVVVVRSAQSK